MTLAVNHTGYENFVLASKMNELLETKLNTRSLMTIDTDLTSAPGMKKIINRYTFKGAVEKLAKGEGNTEGGVVTFDPVEYEVEVNQQKFEYYDEDFMTDPKIVDVGMEGMSVTMVNDLNRKYFDELEKATLNHQYTGAFNYDAVVDSIELMNIEDETGLFLVIGTDLKAQIRKDPDFKGARQGEILFNGQIGSVSGVPVIVSKKTPKTTAYLATKEAVTLFVKKESEVEQERDANVRLNTVYGRKVHVVALTDATKVVKIAKAPSRKNEPRVEEVEQETEQQAE